MALDQKDIELIERIVYRCSDDISTNNGRSFERIHERVDDAETRIYSRIADVEDRVEGSNQSLIDILELLREDVRELISQK